MTRANRHRARAEGIDPGNPVDLAQLDLDECGHLTDTTARRIARQRAAYDRGACQCGWGRGHLAPCRDGGEISRRSTAQADELPTDATEETR